HFMNTSLPLPALASALLISAGLLLGPNSSLAYPRYRDPATGAGNCSTCHGAFTDSTSPKGTVFPSASKHEMHRAGTSMATACNLCHSSGDNRNPFTGSSAGTASNPGLGCSGCHVGAGLRAHHAANGVTECLDCHGTETSVPENVKPPYYGTADTKANNPANLVPVANTNENWSVGDFIGLDNDGNNLYDAADLACNPYQILSTAREGNNLRITWRTGGGRTDAVQAAAQVNGTFTNLNSKLSIPGVGVVTTNYVEVGGATNKARFYRVRLAP
ncbi:MAG TPA: hypothetical protein VNT26_12035, partial [Candidatus Sulfotelmatobacter sp.]|nr:hypothetical protein [Candidatus Sulfotelmatobacter sp.]